MPEDNVIDLKGIEKIILRMVKPIKYRSFDDILHDVLEDSKKHKEKIDVLVKKYEGYSGETLSEDEMEIIGKEIGGLEKELGKRRKSLEVYGKRLRDRIMNILGYLTDYHQVCRRIANEKKEILEYIELSKRYIDKYSKKLESEANHYGNLCAASARAIINIKKGIEDYSAEIRKKHDLGNHDPEEIQSLLVERRSLERELSENGRKLEIYDMRVKCFEYVSSTYGKMRAELEGLEYGLKFPFYSIETLEEPKKHEILSVEGLM
ncbi:hypothetical protein KY343_01500 [Candidatus Woesearchaeota archaeon]|nr:hypothetical protein [Candidatus Woesearchaeota archaeon]